MRGAGLLVLALGVVLLTWPRLLGAHGLPGVAHAIALRPLVGLTLLGLGLTLVALPARRRLLPFAAVLLVGAGAHAAALLGRGLAAPVDGPAPPSTEDAVVVLTANTLGATDAAPIAGLVLERRAHVVVLVETSPDVAQAVADRANDAGREFQVLAHEAGAVVASTALLVDRRLGDYTIEVVLDAPLATFTAVSPTGPPLTAAHASPPLPGAHERWSRTTRAVVDECRARPGAIVAGDLNATVDHPAFDRPAPCVDALSEAGAGATGTWPAALPWALGAQIDHVLADGRRWEVVDAAVLAPLPGSDHRPVEAVLRPRG